MIEQIALGLLSAIAIFLSQDTHPERQRYACLFGLASQPFWFYATWQAHQWGMFALAALYTLSWLRGLDAHWLRAGGARLDLHADALAIADDAMLELLANHAMPASGTPNTYLLIARDCHFVRTLAEADPAIQEAYEWLSARGLASLRQGISGQHIHLREGA